MEALEEVDREEITQLLRKGRETEGGQQDSYVTLSAAEMDAKIADLKVRLPARCCVDLKALFVLYVQTRAAQPNLTNELQCTLVQEYLSVSWDPTGLCARTLTRRGPVSVVGKSPAAAAAWLG
jgi:hypothetical protein